MSHSEPDMQATLLPVMNQHYAVIYPIELEWGIRLHEGDQRPRIDYFHDAPRALTSGSAGLYAKHSRLSVEHLAYDLAQLRKVQTQPLSSLNKMTRKSTDDSLITEAEASQPRRQPDREMRQLLLQHYQDYTVLFAAMFAAIADDNFHARMDEIDETVKDIAEAEAIIKQLASGELRPEQALAMLEGIEQDQLREKIQAAIRGSTIRRAEADQLIASLHTADARLAGERMSIEKAHMHYATARLAVYEQSRETVKRMAMQGMNLAGKFVQSAMQQQAGRQGVIDR